METQEYKVQRKVITWEQVYVDATSFDEAVELAEEQGGWDEVYDASEATEDYWVENLDTDEIRVRAEGEDWKDGI